MRSVAALSFEAVGLLKLSAKNLSDRLVEASGEHKVSSYFGQWISLAFEGVNFTTDEILYLLIF